MVGKVFNKIFFNIMNLDGVIEISNNLYIGFFNDLEFVFGGFIRFVF